MDLSHLIDKVATDSKVPIDRHPGILAAYVSKLDADAHPVARVAAETAIASAQVSYKSHSSLQNDLAVLESYMPGRSKVPSSSEEINAAITKFNRGAAAAVTRGVQATERAEAELGKSEEQLQKQIRAATHDPLITPDVAREIRQHVKSLGPQGARTFISGAIGRGDLAVLTAVRDVPAFLSGIEGDTEHSPEEWVTLMGKYAAEKHAKDFVVQLDAVRALKSAVKSNRESLQSKWQAAQKVAKPRTVNVFTSEA